MTATEGAGGVRTQPVDACPACGAVGGARVFQAPDRLHGVPGLFGYRRCRGCATVFQDPRVTDQDLPGLYPADYYTHAHTTGVEGASAAPRAGAGARDGVRDAIRDAVAPGSGGGSASILARVVAPVLARSRWLRVRAFGDQVLDELIPWQWPAGRALDVGCGSGKLMLQLTRVGWEVEGAEWDPEAARTAQANTGLPVHIGGASSVSPDHGPFDLVVLSHVFEHLADPVADLKALSGLLAPGGQLVVVYPNPESLLARWFGADWYHWDPPRHLVLPPGAALAGVARRAGLRLVAQRTLWRWAASAAGASRAYRRGRVPPVEGTPDVRDRAWAFLEGLLVTLGADVGEEIVAVFMRDAGAPGSAGGGG